MTNKEHYRQLIRDLVSEMVTDIDVFSVSRQIANKAGITDGLALSTPNGKVIIKVVDRPVMGFFKVGRPKVA